MSRWSNVTIRGLLVALIMVASNGLCAEEESKNSANDAVTQKLVKQIFGDSAGSAGCKVISRGPGAKLGDYDDGLQKFASDLLTVLKDANEDELAKFFHPRLNTKGDIGRRLFATLRNRYELPWQFSIYRVFALNSVTGDKVTVPCAEDEMEITTLYGYPLAFGMWFQLMAQNELSRIFAIVVQRDGHWVIGGFHIQQWTFMGKDVEKWAAEAMTQLAVKDLITAYVKFDIAQKMLFGGDFLNYPLKDKIIASRNEALSKGDVLTKVKEVTKNPNLVYVGTALGTDGPGFLLRERTLKDLTTPELKASCMKMGKALVTSGLIKGDLGGVHCDFIYPQDDPQKKGQLGGFFYSRKDLEAPIVPK